MSEAQPEFELVEFEQVEPAPGTALLRVTGHPGSEPDTAAPALLIADGGQAPHRVSPLPGPPSPSGTLRIAFSAPTDLVQRATTFALELADGSVIRLPQPSKRAQAGPDQLRAERDQALADRNQALADRNQALAGRDEAESRARAAAAGVGALEFEARSANESAARLQAELESARAETEAMRAELDTARGEAEALRAEGGSERVQTLEDALAARDAHLELLEGERAQLAEQHQRLTEEYAQLADERARLLEEHGRALDDHGRLLSERAGMQASADKLFSQLEDARTRSMAELDLLRGALLQRRNGS